MTMLSAAVCINACVGHASAQEVNVWGFPLGATTQQLRAAVGNPTAVRATRASGWSTPSPKRLEVWAYKRYDVTYSILISDGVALEIEATGILDPSQLKVFPPDPLGLHFGDTIDDVLVKSAATPAMKQTNNVHFLAAMVSVNRGGLNYTFQIVDDYIAHETVELASSK